MPDPLSSAIYKKDLEHPPEIWVQVFEHIAEQNRLYRVMLGKNGSPWFTARMREYIVKLALCQGRTDPSTEQQS